MTFKEFEKTWVKFFGPAKTKSQLRFFFNFANSLGLKK